MRVLSWDAFAGSRALRSVHAAVTIGVFDGIHLGHRRLLDRVLSSGADESLVVTFRYNPRRFLKPHLFPGDITTLDQKIALLDELGVDTVLLIDFSNDFSKLSGRDFLVLIQRSCELELLVLGDNFRCGREGATSAYDARDILGEYHVNVDVQPPLSWKGATLSSTRIRAAIREGELEEARNMMGRGFILNVASAPGTREENARRVEKTGLHQVLPPPGGYLVDIITPTKRVRDKLFIDHEKIEWFCDGDDETKNIEFISNLEEGA